MKKLLPLLLFFIGLANTPSMAQCVPDKSLFDTHVPPNYLFPAPYDEDTQMGGFEDTACTGRFYETVLNFVIPREVEVSAGTFLPVVNITVDEVTGLPDGLSYQCTPSDCIFEPSDTVACVLISGTIDAAVTAGNFDLGIEGNANVGFPVPLGTLIAAGGGGSYFITVVEVGGPECIGVATENLLAEKVRITSNPNPFSYFTNIEINSDISDDFEFRVVNALGATVHQREVRIDRGANQINFDGSELAEGLYVYILSNASGQVSGKLMLNR